MIRTQKLRILDVNTRSLLRSTGLSFVILLARSRLETLACNFRTGSWLCLPAQLFRMPKRLYVNRSSIIEQFCVTRTVKAQWGPRPPAPSFTAKPIRQ